MYSGDFSSQSYLALANASTILGNAVFVPLNRHKSRQKASSVFVMPYALNRSTQSCLYFVLCPFLFFACGSKA